MKKVYIYGVITFIFIIAFALFLSALVKAAEPKLQLIDSTAYWDSYGHGYGANGGRLIDGVTCAYRPEDIGKTAILYDTEMRLIGIYEITDTGYGQSTHKGSSKILKGRSVGTIENGTCIDIYMSTRAKCVEWGRRKVYVQIINARG